MPLELELSEYVDAPPEVVFQVATDLESMGEWMPNFVSIEKLTEGDVGAGTQFRETRKMFGKAASEHFEVTHYEPPHRMDLYVDGSKGASKKGEFRFRHTFEPEGNGTRMTIYGQIDGMGRMMKLMGRMFVGMFKKAIAKDMKALKAYAEKRTGAAAP